MSDSRSLHRHSQALSRHPFTLTLLLSTAIKLIWLLGVTDHSAPRKPELILADLCSHIQQRCPLSVVLSITVKNNTVSPCHTFTDIGGLTMFQPLPGPERLFLHCVSCLQMPVCSYFLKGICNNSDCPYSHVYVSSKAEVCEDFVKGYCPEGEKVRGHATRQDESRCLS